MIALESNRQRRCAAAHLTYYGALIPDDLSGRRLRRWKRSIRTRHPEGRRWMEPGRPYSVEAVYEGVTSRGNWYPGARFTIGSHEDRCRKHDWSRIAYVSVVGRRRDAQGRGTVKTWRTIRAQEADVREIAAFAARFIGDADTLISELTRIAPDSWRPVA